MEENLNTAANTAEVAEPQTTEVTTTEETTEGQGSTAEVTQTQAFARRLKEETAKVRDEIIREIYGAQGINSYAEYQAALEAQRAAEEAQKRNIDPEFYQEFHGLKQEVNELRREKMFISQEAEIKSDPVRGPLYEKWADEVKQFARQVNTDLKTAFLLTLDAKLGDVLNGTKSQAEQEAVKKIIQNQTTSPGSLSQGADTPTKSVWSMNKSDFDALVQKALRGEVKEF